MGSLSHASMSFTSKVPASPTQKPSRMGGFTFNSQLTLAKFSGLPVKTPSTTTTLSSSLTKWKANNDQNGKVGTAKLKPAIVECVKLINVLHSKATTAGDPELDDDEVALWQPKKKRKKGDGTTDLLTIFKAVDSEDLSKGYTCKICKCMTNVYLFLPNNGDSPISGKQSRANWLNMQNCRLCSMAASTSPLHTHISRMGMGHYNWYQECCIMKDLEMHNWCIPEEELDCLAGKSDSKEQYVCSVLWLWYVFTFSPSPANSLSWASLRLSSQTSGWKMAYQTKSSSLLWKQIRYEQRIVTNCHY